MVSAKLFAHHITQNYRMLIKYLHAMEYYLIMKAHLEEKTSLLKK